jgi:hypothetical protein
MANETLKLKQSHYNLFRPPIPHSTKNSEDIASKVEEEVIKRKKEVLREQFIQKKQKSRSDIQ